VGGGTGQRTPSGAKVSGPWAPFSAGPKVTPRPFSYFLFFFHFSFSDFLYFFHIICKFDLNQVKPFSEILSNSQQCSKSIIKQVFKTNRKFSV
jgi:hypothetical protein